MKQVVIKRLLKQEDSTLNRQFEDFAGFYGFKPILCRPYWGQTKGKVERTVQFVRDNFMVGIKYNSLADLNGQALAWCNKVNGKVHATTNEIPFERLKKEGLSPLTREYIIDKINLRRVQKDCLTPIWPFLLDCFRRVRGHAVSFLMIYLDNRLETPIQYKILLLCEG
ncbi:hypothetical protein AALA83_06615 [Oscillospiraceae bacterium 44-5]